MVGMQPVGLASNKMSKDRFGQSTTGDVPRLGAFYSFDMKPPTVLNKNRFNEFERCW